MRRQCCCAVPGCTYKPNTGTVACVLPKRDLWLTTEVGGFPLLWLTNAYFTGWYAILEWMVPPGTANYTNLDQAFPAYPACAAAGGRMRWLVRIDCVGAGQESGGRIIYAVAPSNNCKLHDGNLIWTGTGGTGTAPSGAGEPNWAVRWPFQGVPSFDNPVSVPLYPDGVPTCSPLSYPIKVRTNSLPPYGGLGKMVITE